MAHPYKGAADKSRAAKAKCMADGGGIDEGIDVSTPGPGQYPYGLGQKMQHARSVMDREEIDAGKRFSDTGTRIPGVGKAKLDNYMKGRR